MKLFIRSTHAHTQSKHSNLFQTGQRKKNLQNNGQIFDPELYSKHFFFVHCVTYVYSKSSPCFSFYTLFHLCPLCCIISNSPGFFIFLCFSLLLLLAYKDKICVFHSTLVIKLSSQLCSYS